MDWIHCNKCFTQLDPGITLHLTSCGHMFCNNCLNNGVKVTTCLVCRVPCSIMKLVPDMDQEVQDYFTDPEELLKKCCEVTQFQKQHRRRLLSYLLQSVKKFYAARTELKRVTEICQKQQKQLKECHRVIKCLESQLTTSPKSALQPNDLATHYDAPYVSYRYGRSLSGQVSPFNVSISPGNNLSPSFIQTTPTYKRPGKSTPYGQPYQSNLVTPARISKHRSSNISGHSQKLNNSNRISSTVNTPPTPESVGFFSSQASVESGYSTGTWQTKSPNIVYCNGITNKCAFKRF